MTKQKDVNKKKKLYIMSRSVKTLKSLAYKVQIVNFIKQNLIFMLEKILRPVLTEEPNRSNAKIYCEHCEIVLNKINIAEKNIKGKNIEEPVIKFKSYCSSRERLLFSSYCDFQYVAFNLFYTCTRQIEFIICKYMLGREWPNFESLKKVFLTDDIDQVIRIMIMMNNIDSTLPKILRMDELRLQYTDVTYIIGNTRGKSNNKRSTKLKLELWECFEFDHINNDTSGLNLCENGPHANIISYYQDFLFIQTTSKTREYKLCYGHPLLYIPEQIHSMYSASDIKKLRLKFVLFDDISIPTDESKFRTFLENCQIYKAYIYLKKIVPNTSFINYAKQKKMLN